MKKDEFDLSVWVVALSAILMSSAYMLFDSSVNLALSDEPQRNRVEFYNCVAFFFTLIAIAGMTSGFGMMIAACCALPVPEVQSETEKSRAFTS